MIYTGWGNTFFFHFGNFSRNRALAIDDTRLGSVDSLGVIGYVFGATTIPCTVLAMVLVAMSARDRIKDRALGENLKKNR